MKYLANFLCIYFLSATMFFSGVAFGTCIASIDWMPGLFIAIIISCIGTLVTVNMAEK